MSRLINQAIAVMESFREMGMKTMPVELLAAELQVSDLAVRYILRVLEDRDFIGSVEFGIIKLRGKKP